MEMAESGWNVVPAILDPRFCLELLREVADQPFQRKPLVIGPVQQETEELVLYDPLKTFPSVSRLRDNFTVLVRAHSRDLPSLAHWTPNDVAVQRYLPGSSLGITPHRDGKRFVILVAIFTIRGRARFAVCRDRSGEIIEHWTTQPGDLVLLGGPELQPGRDDRPFHMVSPPLDIERYSIALRMDTKLGTKPR